MRSAGLGAASILVVSSAWAQAPDVELPERPPEVAAPEPPPAEPAGADSAGAEPAAVDPAAPDPDVREPVPMVIPDFTRQPEPPDAPVDRERYRFIWNNLTVGRINPLGAINQFRAGLRVQLSNAPGVLWEESYAALLLNTAISPAYGRIGGRVEIAPLAVLKLSAQYDYFGNFGAFNHLQTFDSPAATYDDETLEGMRDQNAVEGGGALELEALVQAKVGPVAVRNNLNGYLYRMNRPRSVVFYDAIHDTLHPNGGWGVQDDLDLLWIFDFGLKLGARYTYNEVFYPERFAIEGTAAEDNTPTHRVGPAALYTFFEDPPGAGWNKPTLGVLAQWWLKHRYRTGQDISQALPYILIVIIQEGDFFP